jgi:23S rRNA (cytosine1962-C5)-methyltransferase
MNSFTGRQVLITTAEQDYELLDSGEGEKLERFGQVVLARPDPQALWPKLLPPAAWQKADGFFGHLGGRAASQGGAPAWHFKPNAPKEWQISFGGSKFVIRPSVFKHVGLFPEQRENWNWIREAITVAKKPHETVSVLNLFGYTGGATLAAAEAGADVCHLDGSKAALAGARENAIRSGLGSAPIRWILDDAATFVRREIKRGRRYDAIILDPPAFGRGPKGQVWKIEDTFLDLLKWCRQALSDQPVFFLINGYASGYSAIAYYNALSAVFKSQSGGQLEAGELAIAESAGRLLPAGIFARWRAV